MNRYTYKYNYVKRTYEEQQTRIVPDKIDKIIELAEMQKTRGLRYDSFTKFIIRRSLLTCILGHTDEGDRKRYPPFVLNQRIQELELMKENSLMHD